VHRTQERENAQRRATNNRNRARNIQDQRTGHAETFSSYVETDRFCTASMFGQVEIPNFRKTGAAGCVDIRAGHAEMAHFHITM